MLIDNNDKNLVEKKISSEKIFDGVLLHVRKDSVELPNGHTATREWIEHPGASAVIPLLPDNQIILVRQFRYPIGQVTLEVPAGKLDKVGEDPIECAKRELSEETEELNLNLTPSTVMNALILNEILSKPKAIRKGNA